MITCDTIDMIGYLEGIDSNAHIQKHIDSCPHCRKEKEKYMKLLQGVMAVRQSEFGECPDSIIIAAAAIDGGDTLPDHIRECARCRKIYETAAGNLSEIDREAAKMNEPLPPKLRELVAARKKKWLENRAGKVIALHGSESGKGRSAAIQNLLDQDLSGLPKAATPDDLAGDEDEET